MKKNKFINPYNFVSLGKEKSPAFTGTGNHSGYINVELNVKDTIIIPGCKKEEKLFDYYHYDGETNPVIPSSQVRGTIRNVYEALTNSCLSKIEECEITLRNGMKPQMKPYIMYYENGKWLLVEARVIRVKGNKKVDDSTLELNNRKFSALQNVSCGMIKKNFNEKNKATTYSSFEIFDDSTKSGKSILCIGEKRNDGRRKVAVFEKMNKTPIELRDLEVFYFKVNLEGFTDSKHKKLYLDAYKNKKAMAVYASNEFADGYYRISKSQIGRVPDFSGITEKEYSAHNGYQTCKEMNKLCPACSLFGTINGNEKNNSRVRILDFKLKNNSSYTIDKPIELVTLGPNISNPDFYTEKDNPWLSEYARIRGRKFYWHFDKKHFFSLDMSEASSDTKCSYISLSKENEKPFVFEGKIYFENLNDLELKNLLLAISLGNDGKHGHKMGHGKPLGYGSVVPKITSLFFRSVNVDNLSIDSVEKDINSYSFKWNDLMNKNSVQELEKMVRLNVINEMMREDCCVGYPFINEKSKGFDWFMDNKNTRYEKEILPNVLDSNLFLSTEHRRKNNNFKKRY